MADGFSAEALDMTAAPGHRTEYGIFDAFVNIGKRINVVDANHYCEGVSKPQSRISAKPIQPYIIVFRFATDMRGRGKVYFNL